MAAPLHTARGARRGAAILLAAAAALAPALAAGLAPGFTPPPAGSYHLERIFPVPDGLVQDSDGSSHRLREFTTGKVTLFSLVYTYCTDAKGCPLAYAALHALRTMVAGDPALRGQVRFVSMSFEPEFDTPAIMRSYGGPDAVANGSSALAPWHFLTTASARALLPILDGFGQDVTVLARGQAGVRAPVLGHLLKVYLIDRSGIVREIYSTTYLHPAVLRNDIATLLMEHGRRAGTGPLIGRPDRNASRSPPSMPGNHPAAAGTPVPARWGRSRAGFRT
jgi:cytochrome oxidase Cu insertion factor (SCO1/SenC/PrrC family)